LADHSLLMKALERYLADPFSLRSFRRNLSGLAVESGASINRVRHGPRFESSA
jgi:hypothetical protein